MKGFFRWIFQFVHPPQAERINLNRRAVIAAGVAGLSGGFLFRTNPLASGKSFSPELIRPPGSVKEADFLARCVRCGECMKVCPTNAIHPTFLEAGLEGMWSPILKMSIGYCEYECTLCTQVCPTDAIAPLTPEAKLKTKIGMAFFDKNRCLPYAFARTCLVCEEHCPTPKKAIWVHDVEMINPAGEKVIVKQPNVDPDLCIGCGICQIKCPINDQPGIYVTSAGETRNPENQVLLTSGMGGTGANPYGG